MAWVYWSTEGGDDDTWGYWLDSAATSTSATTWSLWTTGTSTAYTASSDMVWTSWTTSASTVYAPPRPAVTPEQQARWGAERATLREAAARREAERAAARDKARALLLSMLSVRQREQLERERFFEIVGQSGKHYRIRQGTHGNVRLLDGGREVGSYCGQPVGVPDEDAMLAQKLQLEYDEARFVAASNYTRM